MRVTGPVNELIGGVPLIHAVGTPRTIGEILGYRLKPRLQVLAQYLREQFTAALVGTPHEGGQEELMSRLRNLFTPLAQMDPGLWMEIESMARAADLGAEELLLIHGYGDLLSFHGCAVPPMRSTFVALAPEHTDTGKVRMVHAWHLDPALYPYITLVRRVPSHGPASLTLTLAGLHPVAGVSQARIGACVNELRVKDGKEGHFISHLLASVFTAPSITDASRRIIQGPRQGGAAIHLMSASERLSVELSGQLHVRLDDRQPGAPRVHTNHALDEAIQAQASIQGDPGSKSRLVRLAAYAVEARGLDPGSIAGWFGLDSRESSGKLKLESLVGMPSETTVITVIDPSDCTLHLRRGGTPAKMESTSLDAKKSG